MKLIKPLWCVPPGEIYPRELAAGEECPPEFEESARLQGCLKPASAETANAKPKKGGGKSILQRLGEALN
jgi:hypothetical protein